MKEYQKLFALGEEAASDLPDTIIKKIVVLERRRMRIRFALYSTTTLVALVALVPALQYVGIEMAQSGFSTYLSLIFSDSGTILASWKEFSTVLVESLPVIGVTLVFGILLTLLTSLRQAVKNIRYRVSPQLSF
jgi:hypothetical protein